MKQNFKPITKQLAIAALILTSVTVLSFCIRQVRFSAHRVDSGQSFPSVSSSNPEDQSQPEQSPKAYAEPAYYPAVSHIADAETDPQNTEESFWDEQVTFDDYSEKYSNSDKAGKAVSVTKSFKDNYAKAKDSKGLEKISLSDNEDLYFSEEGEFWYVSKGPDGSTTKMQVLIDDDTGELTAVDGGYYAKSEGSQDFHRISMSDNEDIYISEEDEAWYVSEQPDGTTVKMQLPTD